ncbi:MAG: YrzE family protein [Actinomycetota bacterium]|nr:YrzE family protein [Actinomycetota bacterium]
MLGKNKDTSATDRDTHVHTRDVARARGGVSFWSILTGVVVAYGAFLLVFAIVAAATAASGVDADAASDATREVGIGVAIGAVVTWFLSFLWGGYTAGRMGRGAGAINGLLVPVVFLLIGAIITALISAFGETANLQLPFTENQLPIQGSELYDYSIGFGIATLVAMFLGAILGGMMGQRWHTKLERRAVDHEESVAEEHRREAIVNREENPRDTRLEEARRDAATTRTDSTDKDVDLRDRSAEEARRTTAEQQRNR